MRIRKNEAVLLFTALLALAVNAAAQQPRAGNAQIETRAAAAGLEREFRALVERSTQPAWIAWGVPVVTARHRSCCGVNISDSDGWSNCCTSCRLEGKGGERGQNVTTGKVQLEGPRWLFVLVRAEGRAVTRIQSYTEECELDAGGLPFFVLTGVRPAESITLLSGYAAATGNRGEGRAEREEDGKRVNDAALTAIALHGDAAADAALERFVAPSQSARLREKASFWLGAARGRRGYEVLRKMVREDPDERVREKVVFGLHVSKEPEAVDTMIATARSDSSSRVRGQALFWLGQKAGQKASAAITEAIERDPETEVKKRAVFALSQLPKDEGVPLLIQLARSHKNPAVRKQAIFWLGQSKDPRALAFFEEVLSR